MKLNIETFSNIKGGNSFYKAATHPLAARAVPRLFARIGDRKLALYDPQGLAQGFAEFYRLNELRLVGSYVQDVAGIGKSGLGRAAAPGTRRGGSGYRLSSAPSSSTAARSGSVSIFRLSRASCFCTRSAPQATTS